MSPWLGRCFGVFVVALAGSGCAVTYIGDRGHRSQQLPDAELAALKAARGKLAERAGTTFAEALAQPDDALPFDYHPPSKRKPVSGVAWPRVLSTTDFVGALPVIAEGHPAAPESSWFTIKQSEAGSAITIAPKLTAVVDIGRAPSFTCGARLFTSGPVADAEQRGFRGAPPEPLTNCQQGVHGSAAAWWGFASKTRTATSLDWAEYQGTWNEHRGEAAFVRAGKATALVPGVLYAARKCPDEACSTGNDESLVVIGPPAEWLSSSSADSEDLIEPHNGSFSHVEVPIRRGSAQAVILSVKPEHLQTFRGKRNDPILLGASEVSFTVDVLWPSSAPQPAISVQMSVSDKPASEDDDSERSERPVAASPSPKKPDAFPGLRRPLRKAGRR